MKKILLFSGVVVFAAAIYFTFGVNSDETSSDLIRLNVEALSKAETSTTWNCVNNTGNCSASCGACGTSVSAKGDLTGTHKCS